MVVLVGLQDILKVLMGMLLVVRVFYNAISTLNEVAFLQYEVGLIRN